MFDSKREDVDSTIQFILPFVETYIRCYHRDVVVGYCVGVGGGMKRESLSNQFKNYRQTYP